MLELVNAVLVRLGESPLDTLEAHSDVAVAVAQHVGPAARSILASSPWPWATVSLELQRLLEPPPSRWRAQGWTAWQVPDSALRVDRIWLNGREITRLARERDVLWMPISGDQDTVPVADCVVFVPVDVWPADVREALEHELVHRLAIAIREDRQMSIDAARLRDVALMRARARWLGRPDPNRIATDRWREMRRWSGLYGAPRR